MTVASTPPSTPFLAGQLATPLTQATMVDASVASSEAARILHECGFDQAPVSHGGATVGWVHQESLDSNATVGDSMTALSRTSIVAASSSVSKVLEHLDAGFIFTVDDAGLSGFIVPSDVDRYAVRGHFYVSIAQIEIALADIIDRNVPQERVEAEIASRPAGGRYRKAVSADTDTRIVEYLDFRDLTSLFRQHMADLPTDVRTALMEADRVRNSVMHPSKPLSAAYSPSELVTLNKHLQLALDYILRLPE